MADEADSHAPWTIKAVPVATREKAIRHARMDGVTVGVWLARAVDTQADRQDAIEVIPPGRPDRETGKPEAPTVSLADAAAALQALAAAATAGLPVHHAVVTATTTMIRRHMRVRRGLPAGQTQRKIGQTISQGHGNTETA